jgi:hypothetical protein
MLLFHLFIELNLPFIYISPHLSSMPLPCNKVSLRLRNILGSYRPRLGMLQLELAGSLELGSLTVLPLWAHLLPLFLKPFPSLGLCPPCSSFPGGDGWASGGAICHVFAQPLPATSILQVCPPLLFPSAVRDVTPQTLTKIFVFGSESSYNILPTNFDFVCKNYRVYMCTPMSYAGSAPAVLLVRCRVTTTSMTSSWRMR